MKPSAETRASRIRPGSAERIYGLPADLDYHTKVHVTFTAVDDPNVPYSPYDDGREPHCAGCGGHVGPEDRTVRTGGRDTGQQNTTPWHEKCLLRALTDPDRLWVLLAQQIARRPGDHTAGEIRTVLHQLVRLARGARPVDGRVEAWHGEPYALIAAGTFAAPDVEPDGSVVFRRCTEPPF